MGRRGVGEEVKAGAHPHSARLLFHPSFALSDATPGPLTAVRTDGGQLSLVAVIEWDAVLVAPHAAAGAVPSVLDGVLRPSRQGQSDLLPLVACNREGADVSGAK